MIADSITALIPLVRANCVSVLNGDDGFLDTRLVKFSVCIAGVQMMNKMERPGSYAFWLNS